MSASFVLITSLLLMSPDASQLDNETNAGKWSVGAGVSFGYANSAFSLSPGPLGYTSSYTPSYGLGIERYTSPRLTWMLKVSGDYKNSHVSPGYNQYSLYPEGDSQSMSLTLSGGPRWIFNPGQPVEISSFALLRASYHAGESLAKPSGLSGKVAAPLETSSTEEQETSEALNLEKDWGWSLGLSLGIAFDMELIDNLYLRIFSSLASVSKTYAARRSHLAGEESKPVETSDSFGVQFDFRPGLELRMVF
jgi:hypothetical protein